MYFLTANVIMLLAYLSRRLLFLFPPRFCVLLLSLSLVYLTFIYLLSVPFLMFKSNMFLASGRDHPSRREIIQVICR